jgi:hypothetical protein
MARAVSVKIPTAKVIEMIEGKLEDLSQTAKDYPKLVQQYEKDLTAVLNKAIKIAKDNVGTEQISVHQSYSGVSITLNKSLFADVEFPERPADPDNWQSKQNKEQLEKTLKLLRLTEQESVSTSTYNSVLDLI